MAPLLANSQTVDDFNQRGNSFDGESFLGLALMQSHISNKDAPNPSAHRKTANSFYLDIYDARVGLGERSTRYRNMLLTDMITLLGEVIAKPNSIFRREGSGLTSGLVGWIDINWNLTEPGRFQPALGFNFNDYFFGATYVHDTISDPKKWATYEPQGYYFAAGPSASARFALTERFMVQASGQYAFSWWKATDISYAIEQDDYPNPHWLHLNAELLTKWGIYAAFQWQKMINRGDIPNKTLRWDYYLGYRIRL